MSKEQMMDEVINRLGYEHKITKWFCEMAEELDGEPLTNAYLTAITYPVFDEE